LTKIEKRKENLIIELHWKTINSILDELDVVFYGDIKSHDIVKNNKNKRLNIDTNNLKFYTFKTRLLYKAKMRGKKVIIVPEPFTTKTCSFCGTVYDVGNSRIFKCPNSICCGKQHVIGRDLNSGKKYINERYYATIRIILRPIHIKVI